MSTHNICFSGEIRKMFCGYPFLSGAMVYTVCSDSLVHSSTLYAQTHWYIHESSSTLYAQTHWYIALYTLYAQTCR